MANAPAPTAPAKSPVAAPATSDQALAAKAAEALGEPKVAPASLEAQIAELKAMIAQLAANQAPVSANHVVLPPVPEGLIRVIAIRRGTYPNLDAKGNPATRAFIRNEGEVFVVRKKDLALEPIEPSDPPHGWMRPYDQTIAYAPAALPPPTPVANVVPDPLASVPVDPNAKVIPGGPGGFITR